MAAAGTMVPVVPVAVVATVGAGLMARAQVTDLEPVPVGADRITPPRPLAGCRRFRIARAVADPDFPVSGALLPCSRVDVYLAPALIGLAFRGPI
jgi:hypothetical protein